MRVIPRLLFVLHLPIGWVTGDGLKVHSLDDSNLNPPLWSVPDASEQDDVIRNFVSATLGSNMVLQRNEEAIVWGYTQPGATVTTFLHKEGETEEQARLVLTTVAQGDDGLWRQTLPPHPETLEPTSITIKSTTGETQTLHNILWGDVYVCGGQSNMVFAMPANTNGTSEAERGEHYKHIRVFTVGQGTQSTTPLPDLQTVEEYWSEAGKSSLYHGSKGNHMHYFSSVCWFFGREIADGLDNKVPIGLICNAWGGTAVEKWLPDGVLYNAMIHPYMVGPMKISGMTWYQGEANTQGPEAAASYAIKFPEMIQAWRKGFQVPDAYFGFIQLSTWCPPQPLWVAQLRQAQMAALKLGGKTAYATNADHGDGCNIHPPPKQYCGARLGKSALALQYGKQIQWKSPSYSGVATSQVHTDQGAPSIVIELNDVSSKGLYVVETPYNLQTADPFTCDGQPDGICVGGMVLLNGKGWVEASVSIEGPDRVKLTAPEADPNDSIVATSYGWGSVPLMTVYDAETDLPLLPWNEKVSPIFPVPKLSIR